MLHRPRYRRVKFAFFLAVTVMVSYGSLPKIVLAQRSIATIDGKRLLDSSVDPNATYLVTTKKGRRYAGRIDIKVADFLVMTRRNGRIVRMDPSEIESLEKVAEDFTSKTFLQIRAKLEKEFGSKYQVSQTRHFLVVHPPGDYETWALPFEQLFERFKAYFKSRGMTISEPEFPMVAVVLRTQKEFRHMAAQKSMTEGVVGYYSFDSNRLITYQHKAAWQSSQSNWEDTMDTIIHEATHQTACNTGVHTRIAINPRWITEGLATMFEARGVNNFFKYPEPKSRINWTRLEALNRFYENDDVNGKLSSLIASDSLFESQPELAYAMAWGLTSYLAERNPHRYVQYIESLQKDEFSSSLSPDRRIEYFFKSFGSTKSVEAGMRRYIDGLPNRKTVANR